MSKRAARVIAFYLPQFHPIPENDEWWGKGFTEWTNAAKARRLFPGHYQPRVPADLGFYDLRVPETRAAQAKLAREYGVEAFCYYHYWFGGKRIIERPFQEVLASGEPDFPFCLCWANQSWSGIWHGAPDRVLIEQTYPGMDDYRRHFECLLPAFQDRRYLTVDGRPIFVIYNPTELPESRRIMEYWRELARDAGLPGLFLVAQHVHSTWQPAAYGYDAAVIVAMPPRRLEEVAWRTPVTKIKSMILDRCGIPTIYRYEDAVADMIVERVEGIENFPCVVPNWDNTPRSGSRGRVFHGSTPEKFRVHLRKALHRMRGVPDEHRIVFVKSWNEWAEGNYLEPDSKFGLQYLQVLRDELLNDH
jgi:lipopolysaccharide biosynthesis protein